VEQSQRGGQAVSLEEQLRNDAQSLREVGWFNRAIMMDAAANEIQKLNERINRLKEAGNELMYDNDDMANINRWHKAKEAKP
jgi:hypothetical protein